MTALLLCALIAAPTTLEFKLLPPGHDGQVQSVGRARYYLLDEYLRLYQFDQELVKLRLDTKDQQEIIAKLELQLADKDKVISTLEDDKRQLNDRVTRLDKNLDDCEKQVIDLSGGPIWPYVVGAVGAVLGIVGGTMWITSRI
jgi:septal ring factor EnvC (AmiA/AmiB activator)